MSCARNSKFQSTYTILVLYFIEILCFGYCFVKSLLSDGSKLKVSEHTLNITGGILHKPFSMVVLWGFVPLLHLIVEALWEFAFQGCLEAALTHLLKWTISFEANVVGCVF